VTVRLLVPRRWYNGDMRATFPPLACAVLLALTGGACGSPKPATDPSTETTKSDDETPKWEGAAPPPPPLESKPASSGSSAKGVQEGTTQRQDQYDKEGTEVVLKRAARQVKEKC
jgi:hypothetical protein